MICDFSSEAWNSRTIGRFCCALSRRYAFITHCCIGNSVMGNPIHALTLGSGPHRVLFQGAHHANEWLTAPLLLRFVSELAAAYDSGGTVFGEDAGMLLQSTMLSVIPAVNPDGINLVTGVLHSGSFFNRAKAIAARRPEIPFPSGWKANISGIDLNLQYPADWETAKHIKFSQGFTSPSPRDFVGPAPLCTPEARALYEYTLSYSPALTLSYHTQGKEIYWQFQDYAPPCAAALAAEFAALSTYAVAEVPVASGSAGYRDWFLQEFRRPGFTIEAGSGQNPLPPAQFNEIYADNLGILVRAMKPFTV